MRNNALPSILLILLLPAAARAQTSAQIPPPTPPQISPKAVYDQAMHPLELTRHSIGNWSDTEIAALRVTMAQAAAACAARDPKALTGDDLVDLARLCALGQSWPAVVSAAAPYIAATGSPKSRLDEAYAALIDAQLHLKDEPSAFSASQAMLASVPYDALTAGTLDEALAYMQFNDTADALALATAREPLLLACLRLLATPTPPIPTPPALADLPQTIPQLYADGLSFAALQQLTRQPPAAPAAAIEALDAALPATLAPDDAISLAALRRRYAFLGQPLPTLPRTAWPDARPYLGPPGRIPQIPALHAITALLLFPDWCAQCLQMGSQFPPTVFTVSGHEAYFYGLLAETVAPNSPPKDPPAKSPFTSADAANLLAETPTLAVSTSLLDLFDVTDPPFLILTDAQGIIRVLQPAAEDALRPGNTLDSAVAFLGAHWPTVHPAPNHPEPPAVPAAAPH